MNKELLQAILETFNMRASLIAPAYAPNLAATLRSLNKDDSVAKDYEDRRKAEIVAAYGFPDSRSDNKPFAFAAGLAFIPITGTLVNRMSYSWGYITGYNFIRNQMNAALGDPDVKAIVFDINSGGGMVAGCFELANEIYEARATKPSIAVVDSNAYSAAYALASSAGKVVVTPSGGVGSIGALCMHIDISKALADFGVNITLIHAGEHKVDGNPFEALPDSVKADLQASIDGCRDQFVSLVARNRGMESQAVYDTEAACYDTTKAMELGLIDAVASPNKAVSALLTELSGSTIAKENTMAVENQGADTQNQAQSVDPKVAERERIAGILGCDEAKGKSALANHFALNTDMSVDAAKAALAVANAEAAPAAAANVENSAFVNAMNNGSHPQVGADGKEAAQGGENQSKADLIIKNQKLASGELVH
jgi:signal peptide peptidase SppA